MRTLIVIALLGMAGCSTTPNPPETASQTTSQASAVPKDCDRCDPMAAAQHWCQTTVASTDGPIIRPVVMRLVRIDVSRFEAIVGVSDEGEPDPVRLVLEFNDGWRVTSASPAKHDAFWPQL